MTVTNAYQVADITIDAFDASISFGTGETRKAAIDDAVDMAFEVGPLSRALADQSDDVRARASEVVRAAFAARPGERSAMIDGAAWIVTARKTAKLISINRGDAQFYERGVPAGQRIREGRVGGHYLQFERRT